MRESKSPYIRRLSAAVWLMSNCLEWETLSSIITYRIPSQKAREMQGALLDRWCDPERARSSEQHSCRLDYIRYAIAERADLVGLSDAQVLALGADEDRVVVTLNIADFAALHAEWLALGRSQRGLVYVTTTTFPQDRGFIGSMVRSLDNAAQAGELPGRHETLFLARVSE
jgi:Domain of unknown function (DUF5615)